jgi:hypothetical protein
MFVLTKYHRTFPITITLVITGILFLYLPGAVSIAFGEINAPNHGINIFPPNSKPYGLTYGEWSAKWWQWVLSTPANVNPIHDTTGQNCAHGQSGPVWFLAGTSGGGSVTRTCTIPSGKAILFPVLNADDTFVENPLLKTEKDLRNDIMHAMDYEKSLQATIDGINVENLTKYRVQSPLFGFTYPVNNISGAPPGPTQAISDGYWILLQPLGIGTHELHFGGAASDFTTTSVVNFVTDTTYHLIMH